MYKIKVRRRDGITYYASERGSLVHRQDAHVFRYWCDAKSIHDKLHFGGFDATVESVSAPLGVSS